MSCRHDVAEGSFQVNAENQSDAGLAGRTRCGAELQAKAKEKFLVQYPIAHKPGVRP
jgi:hypothetical protein